MFAGKHSAGPAKAGHDFINDQRRISATAPFANSSQCAGWPKAHPGGPLNKRLDHNGSNLRYLSWGKGTQRLNIRHLDGRKLPPGRSSLEHRRGTPTRCARSIAMITTSKSDELMSS